MKHFYIVSKVINDKCIEDRIEAYDGEWRPVDLPDPGDGWFFRCWLGNEHTLDDRKYTNSFGLTLP